MNCKINLKQVHRLGTYQFGLEWRLYFLVLKAFPVDTSEEGMLSDVSLSLQAAAQALGRVLGHQLLTMRNRDENMALEQSNCDNMHRPCLDFLVFSLSSISKAAEECSQLANQENSHSALSNLLR